MSKNMQRLGATLSSRMKKTADGAVPTTIELGIVNSNLSITTDSLQAAIPKGEYMVDIRLKCGTYRTSQEDHSHSGGGHGGHMGGSGTHSHDGGDHDHQLPAEFRVLQPGDRVLVAWCGNEPVVIAIVSSSSVLSFSDSNSPSGGGSSGSDEGGSESGDVGEGGSDSSGQGGTDGDSTTISVTPITGGNRVTIGSQTFDVMDGKTPEKGKDYFTEDDIETIVQKVVDQVMETLEAKFYTKEQTDALIKDNVITGEEVLSAVQEVFGGEQT